MKTCALSRIYTYTTFRRIYISVLPIGSVPIGAGSAVSRFSASCIRFHPEGHVSQQLLHPRITFFAGPLGPHCFP